MSCRRICRHSSTATRRKGVCFRGNPNLHDREIRIDNGWVIKIGRGLDFYQKPGGWFEVGSHDLSLRKCLETKVDIYRASDGIVA
jgi:ATP-dependent Lon protease